MGRGDSTTADPCGDLDALEAKYRAIAAGGKKLFPLSSDNLSYWLSKKGGTKILDTSYFKDDAAVKKHLAKNHRRIFTSERDPGKGVLPRIKQDKKVGAEYVLTWEDSMYARFRSELYFALGGFTLVSKVKVKVIAIEGSKATIRFTSWITNALDVYNWDHGKSVVIPGFGRIDDEEAICLEKAGRAKSFKMKTKPWKVSDKTITGDATIELGEEIATGKKGATIVGVVYSYKPELHDAVGAIVTLTNSKTGFKKSAKADKKLTGLYGHVSCYEIKDVPVAESGSYVMTGSYSNPKTRKAEKSDKITLHGEYKAGKQYIIDVHMKS